MDEGTEARKATEAQCLVGVRQSSFHHASHANTSACDGETGSMIAACQVGMQRALATWSSARAEVRGDDCGDVLESSAGI